MGKWFSSLSWQPAGSRSNLFERIAHGVMTLACFLNGKILRISQQWFSSCSSVSPADLYPFWTSSCGISSASNLHKDSTAKRLEEQDWHRREMLLSFLPYTFWFYLPISAQLTVLFWKAVYRWVATKIPKEKYLEGDVEQRFPAHTSICL